ncbi:MAG: haloacid dehalogenase type II [Burkholderiales bacterium]|nr:haloacid dehalogenase type II [Burkholderiales bacterium]
MIKLRAVLFDVFGTLVDVHSVAKRADELFPGQGQRLSQLWRDKQLEYTRVRAMAARYVPFTELTEDALMFAAESLKLNLDGAARGLLMHEYTQLAAFGDVVPTLDALQARGVTLGVLSNGDPGLLEDVLHHARIGEYFDLVLSADAVHSYKVSPAVYELGPRSLKHPAGEILFVSSNSWDAAGAAWYGYVSFWVNRNGAPMDRLGVKVASGASLADAVAYYNRKSN